MLHYTTYMEVQILERISISPSPLPSVPLTLPLSHLDTDRNLHVTFRTLRLYSKPTNSSNKDPFQVISPEVVSSALSLFLPLTGSLYCREPDSQLEIRLTPSDSIPFIRAVTRVRLSDLASCRPDSPFLNQLVPDLDQSNKPDITKPLIALQVRSCNSTNCSDIDKFWVIIMGGNLDFVCWNRWPQWLLFYNKYNKIVMAILICCTEFD